MESRNQCLLFITILIITVLPIKARSSLLLDALQALPMTFNTGHWTLLQKSVGVSAMHMQLLHNNKLIMFDRTDFGTSNVSLPKGKCRLNDEAINKDCSAHSVLYDIGTNTYRPLMVHTDTFCSSGSINADGILIQTGGYRKGERIVRTFTTCDDDSCDWVEQLQYLSQRRWYATNHILPDNRIIILGGRAAFTYEFYPKASPNSTTDNFYLPFLKETRDGKEENNLYPFVYLLPDGNLYIFANNRSILFDYKANRVVREYPVIPGERRTYPLTGASVLLPIDLSGVASGGSKLPQAEVMICGGSVPGAYFKSKERNFVTASSSCGRLRITDPNPTWVMEQMPMPRLMPDMLLLPNGDVLILNGCKSGAAGWERGRDPVFTPLLYRPSERSFKQMADNQTPRMYHSTAALVPDGRVLAGGSNPHVKYDFNDKLFPTDLSLEAFWPPYLSPIYGPKQPKNVTVLEPKNNIVSYGKVFSVTFSVSYFKPASSISVNIIQPPFVTHSFGMNQRMVVLEILETTPVSSSTYKASVRGPTNANIAPRGYYMLFVVNDGIPGTAVWVKLQ